MAEDQKQYEISFLLKNDSNRESLLGILNKHVISIASQSESRRIKLTYPIEKEDFGSMGCIFFGSKPEAIGAMSQELQTSPGILRFMISVSPKAESGSQPKRTRTIAGRVKNIRLMPKSGPPVEIKMPDVTPKTEEKKPPGPIFAGELSNEALEKKLEEILK